MPHHSHRIRIGPIEIVCDGEGRAEIHSHRTVNSLPAAVGIVRDAFMVAFVGAFGKTCGRDAGAGDFLLAACTAIDPAGKGCAA